MFKISKIGLFSWQNYRNEQEFQRFWKTLTDLSNCSCKIDQIEIQVFLKPQVNTLKNEDHFVFCSAFSIDFKQCCQTRRRPKVNFEKCNQRQDWGIIRKIRTKRNSDRTLERIWRLEEPRIQHLLAILLLAHFLSNFIILPDLFHSGNLSMRQL